MRQRERRSPSVSTRPTSRTASPPSCGYQKRTIFAGAVGHDGETAERPRRIRGTRILAVKAARDLLRLVRPRLAPDAPARTGRRARDLALREPIEERNNARAGRYPIAFVRALGQDAFPPRPQEPLEDPTLRTACALVPRVHLAGPAGYRHRRRLAVDPRPLRRLTGRAGLRAHGGRRRIRPLERAGRPRRCR